MNKLIPDSHDEIIDIARRILVMKVEDPSLDLNGVLMSIRAHLNHAILNLQEWAGEGGRLW